MEKIQFRRDTAANWRTHNPVLAEAELGIETDTKLRKVGDGSTAWNNLEYLAAENIVQEFGDSENAVMSQKALTANLGNLIGKGVKAFKYKGYYYPKKEVGDTFKGVKIYIGDSWNCDCFFVPANTTFMFHEIPAGNLTNGIITNLDGEVTKVIDWGTEPHTQILTLDYDAFVYVSSMPSVENSLFAYNNSADTSRDVIKAMVDDFPIRGKYYRNREWTLGQTVSLTPTDSHEKFNSFILRLQVGDEIDVYNQQQGSDTPNFVVVDTALKIIYIENMEKFHIHYEAEETCYAFFSAQINTNSFVILNTSLTSIKSLADIIDMGLEEAKTDIDDIINIYASQFPFEGYYANYNFSVGAYFNKLNISTNVEGWRSIFIKLLAGETLGFNGLHRGETSSYIYIIDANTNILLSKIDKNDGDIEYTAEQDVYVATSSLATTGSIVQKHLAAAALAALAAEAAAQLRTVVNLSIGATPVYIRPDGTINPNGGDEWETSDFIKIDGNKITFTNNLKTQGLNPTIALWIAFYDENFDFVSGLIGDDLETTTDGVNIEVPEGAVYYRVTFNQNSDPVCQYVAGAAPASAVFKYSVRISDQLIEGYFLNSSGMAVANAAWGITDYIPLVNGAKFYLHAYLTGGAVPPANIVFYGGMNENTFISAITNDGAHNNYNMVLDVPVGAKYVRFSTLLDQTWYINLFSDTAYSAMSNVVDGGSSVSETIDIVVPHYIDVPINRQTDIFLDGIIAEPDDYKKYPLRITGGTSNVLQIGNNQLRYTPTEEGETTVNFIKYNDAKLSFVNNQQSLVFRPVARNVGSGSEVNICISGDSLIDGTNASCEAFRLLNEDGDFVINQIGTRTATMDSQQYKHEGRGSWAWETYINPAYETEQMAGKTNAFMIDGELNFQKYMQNNFSSLSRQEIDYFIMALGTNDVTQGSSYPNDARIVTIINAAKTFIDVLLSSDKGFPNCKIAIGMPGVGAPSFVGTTSFSTVFKMAIQKLNRAYIDTFDNGKYHPNVTCVMHGAYIDRYDGYQHEDTQVNDYTTRTVRRWTNQVHPLPIGYQQWGRGYYGKLRAFLNGLL